jgi:hypothetical protein
MAGRCCRNRTDRAVNTEYGNVRAREGRVHSEPEDCDEIFSSGVLLVVFTADVLYKIMHRKLLTVTEKGGKKFTVSALW